MKKLFLLLTLVIVALSCEMIDEKIDDLLGKRDWVVFAEGTELTANVPSKQTVLNYKFESTLDWEVKTEVEWLEIDPMRGKAGKDIKIQIKVHKNKDEQSRIGYVDLVVENNDNYRITIKQAGTKDEENDDVVVDIPNNQIRYTSTNGEVVEPYNSAAFNIAIISNTYENGQGIIAFDSEVNTIGEKAFYNCSSLASVTIPNSVTTIGTDAFYGCNTLNAVHITDLSAWCRIDFANKYATPLTCAHNLYLNNELITDLTIPSDITIIKDWAFFAAHPISNVNLHNGITSVGLGAFVACSLEFVYIPDSITEIKDAAFTQCPYLTEFKGKFATEDGLALIVDGRFHAFACGSGVTEYTIPEGVVAIGECAFNKCYSLTSVIIPNSVVEIDAHTFRYSKNLTSITIPDSVTSIGACAFQYCSGLTSVTIGDGVNTIGTGAFRDCDSLTNVYCKAINPPTTIVNNNGYWYGFAKEDESGNICNIDCTIYVYTECVEAYKNAEGWSEYADIIVAEGSIPEDTSTSIIRYTTIDENPITPNNNMAVKSNTYTNGEGVLEFYGNIIGDSAFYRCDSLTSVTITDSVTTIGGHAFSGCRSLTSVTILDSVTTIGDHAFRNCSSLTSVTIPDSVTTIGYCAFYGCSSLTSITIPDSVTSIGNYAFAYCSRLTSVTIPDSVTTIGSSAFQYCSRLTKFNGKFASEDGRCLIIDGTLISFAPAGLTEYTIPNSVTTIGRSAFYGCNSLTSVTIPDGVTTIGRSAFDGCNSLTSVTIGDSVTTIGSSAFSDCRSLTSVTIPDSVTTIGDSTFKYCSSLTSVTIPDSVTTIGDHAFDYCSKLTSITIPDSVTTIGSDAFWACSSLTSITIPDSVTTIGGSAFALCSSLTSVTIGDSVTSIGDAPFLHCSSLTEFRGKYASEDGRCLIIDGTLNSFAPAGLAEYTIPDSVTTIGDSAFSHCSSLTSVTIPDSVTILANRIFEGCSALSSITIPDSVTTIGEYAFAGCRSLTSVYCKATTPPVGDSDMFYKNASDRKIYVPMESVEAYKSAEGWSEYADDIVGYDF